MLLRNFIIIFIIFVVGLLTVNEYVFDVKGISIKGVYECQSKELKKVTLNTYYAPSLIWKRAQNLGYSGKLHTGFGEPDNQGSGLFVDVNVEDRKYRLLFGRTLDSGWKDIVLYTLNISNSCTVPNSTLRKDVNLILNSLGINTPSQGKLKFRYNFDLPWLTFTIF
jgi:hypothetical protein